MNEKLKEKIVYSESYKKPYPCFKDKWIPEFKYLPKDAKVTEMRLLKQGNVLRDNNEYEFQDIRIYVKKEKL